VNGRSAGVEEVLQAATEPTIGKVHPLRTMGTGIVSIKFSWACLEGSSQSAVPAPSESGQRCVNGPSKRLPWHFVVGSACPLSGPLYAYGF